MRISLQLALILACCAFCAPAQPPSRPPTLYAQSIQTALSAHSANLELLVLDLRTGDTLANTFAQPDRPIPVGSLTKPFLALAYLRAHPGAAPTLTCRGHPDRCWKPLGHGALALPQALAQSCNAYFLALAARLPANVPIPDLPPPPNASSTTLIGLTPGWLISPNALAHAYASLFADPTLPLDILTGLRAAAASGTASRIGLHPGGVLAKTGTAPCIDVACKASGDGLVLAAIPAAHPTLLLLVRRRATTGAMAAAAASPILTLLQALTHP